MYTVMFKFDLIVLAAIAILIALFLAFDLLIIGILFLAFIGSMIMNASR